MSAEAEAVPGWLAAWRAQGEQPPAQRVAAPRQGYNGDQGTVSPTAEAQRPQPPKANWQGFVEPDRWPYDGGIRREPVLDTDCHPQRVVRHVGWKHCMTCSKPYFSEDLIRLRLCDGCRNPKPILKAAT